MVSFECDGFTLRTLFSDNQPLSCHSDGSNTEDAVTTISESSNLLPTTPVCKTTYVGVPSLHSESLVCIITIEAFIRSAAPDLCDKHVYVNPLINNQSIIPALPVNPPSLKHSQMFIAIDYLIILKTELHPCIMCNRLSSIRWMRKT